MRFDYTFKQLDHSDYLVSYAEEQIGKSTRYLLKEASIHIFFANRGPHYTVEVSVNAGGEGHFKASAEHDNLYAAVDAVCEKLDRQFLKKKEKLQYHKKPEFSREGKLRLINGQLETDYRKQIPKVYRKAA